MDEIWRPSSCYWVLILLPPRQRGRAFSLGSYDLPLAVFSHKRNMATGCLALVWFNKKTEKLVVIKPNDLMLKLKFEIGDTAYNVKCFLCRKTWVYLRTDWPQDYRMPVAITALLDNALGRFSASVNCSSPEKFRRDKFRGADLIHGFFKWIHIYTFLISHHLLSLSSHTSTLVFLSAC